MNGGGGYYINVTLIPIPASNKANVMQLNIADLVLPSPYKMVTIISISDF